jgi:hypothetical protein
VRFLGDMFPMYMVINSSILDGESLFALLNVFVVLFIKLLLSL